VRVRLEEAQEKLRESQKMLDWAEIRAKSKHEGEILSKFDSMIDDIN
jgi:hypothetical protein